MVKDQGQRHAGRVHIREPGEWMQDRYCICKLAAEGKPEPNVHESIIALGLLERCKFHSKNVVDAMKMDCAQLSSLSLSLSSPPPNLSRAGQGWGST